MTASTPRRFTQSRRVLAAAGIGAAGLVIAACGSTAPTGAGAISNPSIPAGAAATPGPVGPTTGNLGDTLKMIDIGYDLAHVTLVKVFDPATGYDPNTTPPDGTRWVGFEGTIVVDGSRAGEDATSFDVTGSDGQTYGTDTAYFLSAFDGCTETDGNNIKSGQTETFCSAVGLPPGVTVAKVGYSTEGVSGSAPAVLFWSVSDSDAAAAATATPTPDISAPTDTPTPDDGTPTDTPSDTPSPSPSPTPS